jgi:hypothetical protein
MPTTATATTPVITFKPYVPFPCILSSKECECERAAPLILIPSERSGNPEAGEE